MKARRLKSIPVFAGLRRSELLRVLECAEEIDVEAGEPLLHEGRWAFEFFAIAEGAVDVLRGGERIAELGPGDVVGELGALSHGQRNATVVAAAPSKVIFIRAQDFRHFADEMPQLSAEIRRLVEERTQSLQA